MKGIAGMTSNISGITINPKSNEFLGARVRNPKIPLYLVAVPIGMK
jgi:hypothetical protein